jgi:hypothetical protein
MAADRNSPEYIEELAERADPDQLWRRNPLDQLEFPPDQRMQLDTAVALRRYAHHLRWRDSVGRRDVFAPRR